MSEIVNLEERFGPFVEPISKMWMRKDGRALPMIGHIDGEFRFLNLTFKTLEEAKIYYDDLLTNVFKSGLGKYI